MEELSGILHLADSSRDHSDYHPAGCSDSCHPDESAGKRKRKKTRANIQEIPVVAVMPDNNLNYQNSKYKERRSSGPEAEYRGFLKGSESRNITQPLNTGYEWRWREWRLRAQKLTSEQKVQLL